MACIDRSKPLPPRRLRGLPQANTWTHLKGGGLVSPVARIDGALAFTPTAQYASAQRVNALLMNFGSSLLHCGPLRRGAYLGEAPTGCPIISLNETNAAGEPAGTPQQGAIWSASSATSRVGSKTKVLSLVRLRLRLGLRPRQRKC